MILDLIGDKKFSETCHFQLCTFTAISQITVNFRAVFYFVKTVTLDGLWIEFHVVINSESTRCQFDHPGIEIILVTDTYLFPY